MSRKDKDSITRPETYTPVPTSVDGLVDAAFRMVKEGQDPSDVLKMVSYGLKKRLPTPDQTSDS